MITDRSYSQPKSLLRPGAIATDLGLDEQWIAATRLTLQTFLQGLCDTPRTRFTRKKLRTLSAVVHQLICFAKHHHEDDLEAVFDSWKDGTLIVPFALQSGNSKNNLDDDGVRIRGGLFGFLKENLPREYVADSWGKQHLIPAAPRKEGEIRFLFEQLKPLEIFDLSRNGKAQMTSVSILHLPKLFILGEVVEEMIIDWLCYEAVPQWHKAIRHDYNLVFGMNKYHRSPEGGATTVEYHTYEQMLEDCDAISPAIAQDEIKLARKANALGMAFLDACCRKYYQVKDGTIEASVKIGSQLFLFGRAALNWSITMEKRELKSIVDRLRTGAIALFGIAPEQPKATTPTHIFGM